MIEKTTNEVLSFTVIMLMVFLCISAFVVAIYRDGYESLKKQAVQRGFALYEADQKTGDTKWRWKTIEEVKEAQP